ncbi:MAG TPA: hypothetical protein VFJ98_02175 [Mycobacteriales bacterium]|nr:hypothetical protein [Mycobacteriales bacterium]
MLAPWLSTLVAKAKVAAVVSAAVAAGGLGGTVALSHIAPASHQLSDPAASTQPADPESADAQDPESAQAGDPASGQGADPEPAQTGDWESGDAGGAGDPEGGQTDGCPDAVVRHGDEVSAVARSTARGKDAGHGQAVADAARSDCGKPHAGSADDADTGASTRSDGSAHSSGSDHAPVTSSAPAESKTGGHNGPETGGHHGATHHDRASTPRAKTGRSGAKPGKPGR